MIEVSEHLKLHNLVDIPLGYDSLAVVVGIVTDYVAAVTNSLNIKEQIRQEWLVFLKEQLQDVLNKYHEREVEASSTGFDSYTPEHIAIRKEEFTRPYRTAIARIYSIAQFLEMDKEVESLLEKNLVEQLDLFKDNNEILLESTSYLIKKRSHIRN
jgi:hypothetical protein